MLQHECCMLLQPLCFHLLGLPPLFYPPTTPHPPLHDHTTIFLYALAGFVALDIPATVWFLQSCLPLTNHFDFSTDSFALQEWLFSLFPLYFSPSPLCCVVCVLCVSVCPLVLLCPSLVCHPLPQSKPKPSSRKSQRIKHLSQPYLCFIHIYHVCRCYTEVSRLR